MLILLKLLKLILIVLLILQGAWIAVGIKEFMIAGASERGLWGFLAFFGVVVLCFWLIAWTFCRKRIEIEEKKRKKFISGNLEDITSVNPEIDSVSKPVDVDSNRCPNCDHEIELGALFCENCGVRIR